MSPKFICRIYYELEPLQRVQNAAARLIFELSPKEHITPSLLQLHWLPVSWRIQYKLCCIMHSGRCPAYLTNIVQPVTARQSPSGLRSSSTQTINFRDSQPSSVSVRSHTLVRPRGTHCLATFVMSHHRKVLEGF